MKKSDERARRIDEAIRLTWWSLESHLIYTHKKYRGESKPFHKKCAKDYARIIKLLSELY